MAAIQANEIVIHPAAAMNQTDSAGGVINSNSTIPTNVIGNLIEDITEAERLAGVTRHYKVFCKIGNSDNKIYKQASLFLVRPLENDYFTDLKIGTHNDTWATAKTERKYGSANLAAPLTAGDQTAILNTRGATRAHFQNGDLISITDLKDTTDITGHMELYKIDQPVSWNGDEATIHFDTPLRYPYAVERTLNTETIKTTVASCLEYGDVKATASISDNTSAHGTTDLDTITLDHIAGIDQILTFSFNDANNYSVTSNIGGITLPDGQKTALYEPQNSTFLRPYLSVPAQFWTNDGSGDWTTGDTVKIETHPAAMPYWISLEIPPGATASDLDTLIIRTNGYSSSN